MKKKRNYVVTAELLDDYQVAALKNAESLLAEASLLYDGGKLARAYFLAVSSIEESGKAYLAFAGKQRNLADEGVQARLRAGFEDHSEKVTAAFTGWLSNSMTRESVEAAVDLMIDLKRGREASMYTDVRDDGSLSMPEEAARPIAARDCIDVANNCLHHTKAHIASGQAPTFSSHDDKFFVLSRSKRTAVINTPNFGEFMMDALEHGKKPFDFTRAVVTYHDKYYSRGKLYEPISGDQPRGEK